MAMVIEYPATFPDALHVTREQFERDARLAMAVKLYEMGRLSSGMAAQLAGIGRVEFVLSLHQYGVAVLDLPPDELAEDVCNAQQT